MVFSPVRDKMPGNTSFIEPKASLKIRSEVAKIAQTGTTYGCCSGGTGSSGFSVDSSTCDVTVAQQLDFETATEYDVIIEVRDLDPVSPRSATATFTVQVLDANENDPVRVCDMTFGCYTLSLSLSCIRYVCMFVWFHLSFVTVHRYVSCSITNQTRRSYRDNTEIDQLNRK